MAPNKSRRSKPGKAKRATRKPKATRVRVKSTSGNGGKSALNAGTGGPPAEASGLTANRPDFPISISLSNLVRLDWQHRQELFAHGPGATKLERFGFKGRTYNVESLEAGETGNGFVELYPELRYYIIPIYEEGQSLDAPQRFLLVRSQTDKGEQGPYILVVEPLEPLTPDDPFAHLHIVGGEDDTEAITSVSRTSGVVIAVLTAMEAIPGQLAESLTETLSLPTKPSASSASASLDEDLLSCIDVLAIAQSSRPNAAKDFDAAHNKFLEYVQKHYGLDNIPIIIGQTKFDPTLGHSAATLANNPALPDGVIVGVLRDGYRHNQKVVREAYVVVNKRNDRADVMPSYSAMQTVAPPPPVPPAPEQPSPEGSAQAGYPPIEDLLLSIDALSVDQSGSSESDKSLEAARQKLLAYLRQSYGLEVIPVILNKTFFDPTLGHYAIGTIYNPTTPDGVIAKITKEGYTHNGVVVREAHVVVNRTAALNKIEIIPSGHYLRLEIATPRLASLGYFSKQAVESLQAVDAIYSILAVTRFGNVETIRQFTSSMKQSPDWFDNPVNVQKFLVTASIEPLRILSLHYGSPIEIIWKVIEAAKDLPKHVVKLIDNYRRREHIAIMDKFDEWERRNQNIKSDLDLLDAILALNEKLKKADITIEEQAIIYRSLYGQLKRISFTLDSSEQGPTNAYP
jgi:molecular chaperone GrpE (heat shock protein)